MRVAFIWFPNFVSSARSSISTLRDHSEHTQKTGREHSLQLRSVSTPTLFLAPQGALYRVYIAILRKPSSNILRFSLIPHHKATVLGPNHYNMINSTKTTQAMSTNNATNKQTNNTVKVDHRPNEIILRLTSSHLKVKL